MKFQHHCLSPNMSSQLHWRRKKNKGVIFEPRYGSDIPKYFSSDEGEAAKTADVDDNMHENIPEVKIDAIDLPEVNGNGEKDKGNDNSDITGVQQNK